jgi:hypothetical protein
MPANKTRNSHIYSRQNASAARAVATTNHRLVDREVNQEVNALRINRLAASLVLVTLFLLRVSGLTGTNH